MKGVREGGGGDLFDFQKKKKKGGTGKKELGTPIRVTPLSRGWYVTAGGGGVFQH